MGSLYRPKYPHPEGGYVTKTGKRYIVSNIYWIKYRTNGKIIRESTGTTKLKKATQFLNRRVGAAADGRPVTPRADKVKVWELAEDLVNDYKANERRSLDRLQAALAHLLPFFGDRRAVQVTPADVDAYKVRRQAEGATNGTINRELTALRRMFNLSVERQKLHRTPRIKALQENNVRKGFFEEHQLEAVLRHLPDYLHPPVRFGYITGWRKGEILSFQWSQVDFQAGTVRLEPGTTKNQEGRTFMMTPALRAILEAQWTKRQALARQGRIIPWVFHRDGEAIKGLRKAWATACRKAGAPWMLFHDLRRTAVRNLERAGVPRSVAMAMVGHKTEAIYRRYAIVDETMMREGAEKLAAWQGQSFGQSEAAEVGVSER